MKRSTLQLRGVVRHQHLCWKCKTRRQCIDPICECIYEETCIDCLSAQDCPQCAQEGHRVKLQLAWHCDDLDPDSHRPVRTCYSADCLRCGFNGAFVDRHDGRGPMRTTP